MEINGSISFLPREGEKPATKKDMKVKCDNAGLTVNAIIDGKYMENNMKAKLLKASGEVVEIKPNNGTDFKLDELHEHLQCSLVEVININQDDIMVVDEEGKYTSNVINVNATVLAQENQAITSWDYIAGNAIVCNKKMIR